MIKGKLSIIGNVEIDGEIVVGAFVECSREELKQGRGMFAEDVAISLQSDGDTTCTCPLYDTAETGECTYWEFGRCNHVTS